MIDTDPRLLKAAERYLKANAARSVKTAESVLAGRNILMDPPRDINCIICAEDLAPITGVEFLKDIRSGKYGDAPDFRGVTFIMMTAHREKELVIAAKKLDVDGYVLKPIDFTSFSSHLRAALGHKRTLKRCSEYERVEIGAAISLPVIVHPPQE